MGRQPSDFGPSILEFPHPPVASILATTPRSRLSKALTVGLPFTASPAPVAVPGSVTHFSVVRSLCKKEKNNRSSMTQGKPAAAAGRGSGWGRPAPLCSRQDPALQHLLLPAPCLRPRGGPGAEQPSSSTGFYFILFLCNTGIFSPCVCAAAGAQVHAHAE